MADAFGYQSDHPIILVITDMSFQRIGKISQAKGVHHTGDVDIDIGNAGTQSCVDIMFSESGGYPIA